MSDLISLPTIPWQTMNLTRLPTSTGKSDLQLKEACSELESLFIYYLFKEMRATVPKSGFVSGGRAEDIYTSMLDFQLAKELSDKGGIGLSSLLLKQLDNKSTHIENRNIKKCIK